MGDPVDPVERALLDLDESWNAELHARPAAEDRGGNDRTIAGLGVGTPPSMPVAAAPGTNPVAAPRPIAVSSPLAHLQPRPRRPTHEPHELIHPEQSPLSFVMRASDSSVRSQKAESHDMTSFVEGLVADTAPVVETAAASATMEPVMRRSRKRRQWLIASAIAATAIVGTVFGMHLAATEDPPKIAATAGLAPESPTAANVEPASSPPASAQPAAAPTAAAPTAPRTDPGGAPPADVPPPADVANIASPTSAAPTVTPVVTVATATAKTRSATKTTTKPTAKKTAPKKVATANPTAKKSAKKSSATKSAIAKKTSAKKPTPAKKATTSTTAKKTRR